MQVSKISFNGTLINGYVSKDKLHIGDYVYEPGKSYVLVFDKFEKSSKYDDKPQKVELVRLMKYQNHFLWATFKDKDGEEFVIQPDCKQRAKRGTGRESIVLRVGHPGEYYPHSEGKFKIYNEKELQSKINYHQNKVNEYEPLLNEIR